MNRERIEIPSIHIGKIDSWSILDAMLQRSTEPCSVVICSFAIAEGWIRRLVKLKERGRITKITVVLDRAVMIRHRSKIVFMERVFDEIYLNDTHAKALLIESPGYSAAAVMSANATMNYRIEAFFISDKAEHVKTIKEDLERIYGNSRAVKSD